MVFSDKNKSASKIIQGTDLLSFMQTLLYMENKELYD